MGRSEPVEDINPADLPAWHYLDLTESDVEEVLEVCTNQIKISQELVT